MKLFRGCLALLGILSGAACERAKPAAAGDSAHANAPAGADTAAAALPARDWDPSAGPVLLVVGETPARAYVVLPEAASAATELARIPHPASVTLFGRGGTVQTAELPAVSDSGACPAASLSAAPPPRPWNVGFVGGVVSPIGMDSTESISHGDSVSIVAAVTRLASAMPNDSAGRFTGLPFVVRSIWRFNILNGPQVVVANLARQINQEATPLAERTLLVAERNGTDTTLTTAYSERSYGNEENIETRDVLAAALLGGARIPALIVAHDYGDATAYGLVERGADGRWRARWASAKRHC
ncbi:MAG: hypothetical protein JWM41_3771 [Gemmatimonadetes bacterium]|nr:hypothetical protein [Gemmatimonadota bacterium]